MKILVIDDELEIAQTICSILCDEGYEARSVPNVLKAFDCLLEFSPDLVIVDSMMPVMDGRQFGAKLRAMPGFDRKPLILMGPLPPRLKPKDAPWDLFLTKPFLIDDLLAVVGQLVSAV